MSTARAALTRSDADLGPAGVEDSRAVTDRELTTVAVAGALVGGLVGGLVATAVSGRRPPAPTISMGPGGWVSFRGSPAPRRIRTTRGPRPWWAHLLHARELRAGTSPRRSHG